MPTEETLSPSRIGRSGDHAVISVHGEGAARALRDLTHWLRDDPGLRPYASTSLVTVPPPPGAMGDSASMIEAVITSVAAVGQLVAAILTWRAARQDRLGSREAPGEIIRITYLGNAVVIGSASDQEEPDTDDDEVPPAPEDRTDVS